MPHGGRVLPALNDFDHEEHLSRQQAAERLVDIAYALVAGATPELRAPCAQQRVGVPVDDDVVLRRRISSAGDRVDVDIRLSWST